MRDESVPSTMCTSSLHGVCARAAGGALPRRSADSELCSVCNFLRHAAGPRKGHVSTNVSMGHAAYPCGAQANPGFSLLR